MRSIFGIDEPKMYIQWHNFSGPTLAGEHWNSSLVSILRIYDGIQ